MCWRCCFCFFCPVATFCFLFTCFLIFRSRGKKGSALDLHAQEGGDPPLCPPLSSGIGGESGYAQDVGKRKVCYARVRKIHKYIFVLVLSVFIGLKRGGVAVQRKHPAAACGPPSLPMCLLLGFLLPLAAPPLLRGPRSLCPALSAEQSSREEVAAGVAGFCAAAVCSCRFSMSFWRKRDFMADPPLAPPAPAVDRGA